jgi:hypothetical protein
MSIRALPLGITPLWIPLITGITTPTRQLTTTATSTTTTIRKTPRQPRLTLLTAAEEETQEEEEVDLSGIFAFVDKG